MQRHNAIKRMSTARAVIPFPAQDSRTRGQEALCAIEHIISLRSQRDKVIGSDLFADPAWDILLDLAAMSLSGRKVTVTDACIAARAPQATALRYISKLEQCGLVSRENDPADRRRNYLVISEQTLDHLIEMFAPKQDSGIASLGLPTPLCA